MTPQEFFDTANRLMETDPPAEADAPLLRSLAALSVGPGQQCDASALGPLGGLRWKRLRLQRKSSLRAQAARSSIEKGRPAATVRRRGETRSKDRGRRDRIIEPSQDRRKSFRTRSTG